MDTVSGTVAFHASYLKLLLDKRMVRMIMELIGTDVSPLLQVRTSKAAAPSKKQCFLEIGLGFPPFQSLLNVYVSPPPFPESLLRR